MYYCDIFIERQFFELFYMQVDMRAKKTRTTRAPSAKPAESVELDLDLTMSFYKIRWSDFYEFNDRTNMFILLVVIMVGINLLYICFSKLYLKRIVRRLQNKKLKKYFFDS